MSFVILILALGIFSQAMNLAGRMVGRSNDTLKNYRDLAGGYYLEKEDAVEIETSQDKSLTFTRVSETEGFTIQVKTKTYTKKDGSGILVEAVKETEAGIGE